MCGWALDNPALDNGWSSFISASLPHPHRQLDLGDRNHPFWSPHQTGLRQWWVVPCLTPIIWWKSFVVTRFICLILHLFFGQYKALMLIVGLLANALPALGKAQHKNKMRFGINLAPKLPKCPKKMGFWKEGYFYFTLNWTFPSIFCVEICIYVCESLSLEGRHHISTLSRQPPLSSLWMVTLLRKQDKTTFPPSFHRHCPQIFTTGTICTSFIVNILAMVRNMISSLALGYPVSYFCIKKKPPTPRFGHFLRQFSDQL